MPNGCIYMLFIHTQPTHPCIPVLPLLLRDRQHRALEHADADQIRAGYILCEAMRLRSGYIS